MNMQKELYTIHFFSPPNDQFAVSPQATIMEQQTHGFLRNSWKSSNSWTRGYL